MRKQTREKINELKLTDVYSLMLFALYQMKGLPEYSTLSELVYVLDKESLFKFLSYYGGTTIKVPTLKEFKQVLNSLLLYEFINLEGMEFPQAFKMLDIEFQTKETKDCYFKIVTLLEKYEFRRK